MKEIISAKNEELKKISKLQDKKFRKESGLYVVEGYNILKDMPSDTNIYGLYVRNSDLKKYQAIVERYKDVTTVVSDIAFFAITDTVNSNGILAVLYIEEAKPITNDMVVVFDNLQEAGNMGTIIRTAVAMGVTDFVSINSVDAYNPKTVRATMGGIYYANIKVADQEEAVKLLQDYTLTVLDMSGRNIYLVKDKKKRAIVVGNESNGVSSYIKESAIDTISIPILNNKIESLNAAISMGIALSYFANNNFMEGLCPDIANGQT